MIGIRRDPNVIRSTVSEARLKWLGRVGDLDYATHDGREYAVDRDPSLPEDYSRRSGEILVMRVSTEMIDGSALEHHRTHRAWPVESGTHAKLAAQAAKAAKRTAEKPMRTWDALSGLFSARRDPYRIRTGPGASDPTFGALKAWIGMKEPRPWIEITPNLRPEPGAAAIVDHLKAHGVELSLGRGRLVAKSRTPIKFDDKALIVAAEALIVGHLKGQATLCVLCSEPAVTVIFPSAPMCAAHAGAT